MDFLRNGAAKKCWVCGASGGHSTHTVCAVDRTNLAAHPCGLYICVALRFERFADFDERGATQI